MSNVILVLIIILIYFGFEYLMASGRLDMNMAVLLIGLIAVGIVAIAHPGSLTLAEVGGAVGTGVGTYVNTMMAFVMYGIFGGILYEFGVIDALIATALKVSEGKSPAIIMIIFVLVGTVTSLGGGSFVVMMIGCELFTALGVKNKYAAVLTCMILATTYYLTVSYYPIVEATTGISQLELTTQAYVITGLYLVVMIVAILIICKVFKPVPDKELVDAVLAKASSQKVNKITFILPFVPLIFILGLKFNAIFTFVICDIIAIIICMIGRRCGLKELAGICTRSFRKGVNDASGLITILMMCGILVAFVNLEPVRVVFVDFISTILPGGKIAMMVVMIIFCLIGVPFRGIGHSQGLGIGMYAAMVTMAGISPMFIATIMMIFNMSSLVLDPTAGSAVICQGFTKTKPFEFFTTGLMINAIPIIGLIVWGVAVYF